MSVRPTLPAPAQNLTPEGLRSSAAAIAAADIIVALGDYTAGAAEDMFTLTAHGLVSGDHLHVLWQSAMGAVTGGEATLGIVKYLTSSTFQLTSDGTTIIENTADGTVVFLKGKIPTPIVESAILPYLIVDTWDFTGNGAGEDVGIPAQGTKGLYEADTLKLLYKSAAGVTAGTLDVTYYAKAPTVLSHQIAATAGGAVIDSTADGTAVFLKTS